MKHGHLAATCLATGLALWGCQGHPGGSPASRFGLERVDPNGQPAVVVAGQAPAEAGPGRVVVSFASLLARKRQVLATLADVDHVTVTLTDAANQQHAQTVAKAAITNGTTTVTFAGLPLGSCSIQVQAYDAGGAVIGVDARSGLTVTAGQALQVAMSVPLNPTLLPTPTPAPPAGGGTGTPTTGGVALSIGFTQQDAKPLIDNSGSFSTHGQLGLASRVDPAGNLYVGSNWVDKIGPDATLKAHFSITPGNTFAFTPDGKTWIDTTLFDAAGNQVATFALPSGKLPQRSDCDAAGNLWCTVKDTQSAGVGTLYKISPTGTKLFECPVNGAAGVRVGANGQVFVNDMSSVTSLDVNGNRLFALGVDTFLNFTAGEQAWPSNATIDPQGNYWVAVTPAFGTWPTHLVKITPTGNEVKCVVLAHPTSMVTSDQAGNIWVDDGTYLLKYSSAGDPLDIYYDPYFTTQSFATTPLYGGHFTLDPAGYVWSFGGSGTALPVRRFRF